MEQNSLTPALPASSEVTVRLYSHKSFRHYGGREITTTPHLCKAELVREQAGHQKYIVKLLEPSAGFKAGHLIAVCENDYNVKQ